MYMKTLLQNINWNEVREYAVMNMLHSLWQGAVLVLAVLIYEFWVSKTRFKINDSIYRIFLVLILSTCLGANQIVQELGSVWTNDFYTFLGNSTWFDLLSNFWIIGVVILSLRLLFMHSALFYIIHKSKNQWPSHWWNLIQSSKQKMGITQKINFLHSSHIQSACVTGLFKPIILFPTCWINGLSLQEAEYILLHELSHIKSKDHFIHSICSIAEVLFFYNPAVHFITGRIKLQREISTDRKVIQYVKNPIEYASLLVKIGENPQLNQSIAFGSVKNQLSIRVKEILSVSYNKPWSVKTFLASVLTIAASFMLQNQCVQHNELVSNICWEDECLSFPLDSKRTIAKNSVIKPKPKITRIIQSNIIEGGQEIHEDLAELENSNIDNIETGEFNGFNNSFLHQYFPEYELKRLLQNSDVIDSPKVIIVVKPTLKAISTGSAFTKRILNDAELIDLKEFGLYDHSKPGTIQYILIKDGIKTIMSYSNSTNLYNLNSNIN